MSNRILTLFMLVPLGCSGDKPDDSAACADDGGALVREEANPVLLPGLEVDGETDWLIADPDVHWDDDAGQLVLYYHAPHGESFSGALTQAIRRATSEDGRSWEVSETHALTVAEDEDAWDHENTETPSVATADSGDMAGTSVLVYSGANGLLEGQAFAEYAIGVALSEDGETFTRISADDSPHGEAGLGLRFSDVYPDSDAGVLADPEIAFHDGTWHLWFSSFACSDGCSRVDAYGVAHATSEDAITWTVDPDAPLSALLRDPGSPSTGGSQPSVFWDAARCQWELWMTSDLDGASDDQPVVFNNASGFYRATSADGQDWAPDLEEADLSWDADAPGEDLGLLTGADATVTPEGRLLVYVGFTAEDVPAGFYLPVQSSYDEAGYAAGMTALNLAWR